MFCSCFIWGVNIFSLLPLFKIDDLSFKPSACPQVMPGIYFLLILLYYNYLIWFIFLFKFLSLHIGFVSRPSPFRSSLWQLHPSRASVCSRHAPRVLIRREHQRVGRHRFRRPVPALWRAQEEDLIIQMASGDGTSPSEPSAATQDIIVPCPSSRTRCSLYFWWRCKIILIT